MIRSKKFWLPLIPCGFTILNLLFFGLLHILAAIGPGANGGILVLWLILSAFALFVLWCWVGWESRSLFSNYGKALVSLNWPAFICLAFALVYYHIVPLGSYLDGAPLLPYHITDYVAGDIFAGLYSSPFMLGPLFPIYGWGNLGALLVSVNTLIGLVVFSIGYFACVISSRFH